MNRPHASPCSGPVARPAFAQFAEREAASGQARRLEELRLVTAGHRRTRCAGTGDADRDGPAADAEALTTLATQRPSSCARTGSTNCQGRAHRALDRGGRPAEALGEFRDVRHCSQRAGRARGPRCAELMKRSCALHRQTQRPTSAAWHSCRGPQPPSPAGSIPLALLDELLTAGHDSPAMIVIRDGRRRQDRPRGALGAPRRRPLPRRPALRQPARLRPDRHGR